MSRINDLMLGMVDLSLNDRDREILRDLRRFRFMRTDELKRIYFVDPPTTKRAELSRATRCLHRLEKHELVTHLPRKARPNRGGTYGLVWRLTETGARLLDLGEENTPRYRGYEPSQVFLDHALAVAEIYAEIHEMARITPDITIGNLEVEKEAARTYHKPADFYHAAVTVKIWPDLFLILKNGKYKDHWYVEIDRGTEGLSQITNKCRRYLSYYETNQAQSKYNVFPVVLWIVPDTVRKARIIETIEERLGKNHQKIFMVETMAEYLPKLVSGVVDDGMLV